METFAQRLKAAIERLGISQAEAARRCGISQQSINYIISNNLKHSKMAVKIASGLDINPDWLIYGQGKFKEASYYEIPVFSSAYEILKYIHNDSDENALQYMVIDIYLGNGAFAFLVEPNKLAICCKKEYNIEPIEYLCINGTSTELSEKPSTDLAFSVIEWRTRHAKFKFF